MEYATLSARLASFPAPVKRSKAGWPHKTPTPEALANAGFYYTPQGASNDNVVCYLCARFLDGWEEDDDPVQEHLRHSPDCGWALLMSQAQVEKHDPSEMQDPTCGTIAEARRATFSIGWPHESKRGWVCKTDKMVEAGWHFAPTEECEDFVSCAYCKLSLDGWEPKDNPFAEHYRRNPDCPFFVFAGTTAPSTRPKAKKGRASKSARTSKASTRVSTRLSTQSNLSMTSEMEAPSMTDIPDLEESIDTSTMSVMSNMSTTSTATNKGKRKAAGGRKTTKPKKSKTTRSMKAKKTEPDPEEVVEIPEPEPEAEEQPQPMQEASPREKKEPVLAATSSPTPVAPPQEQEIDSPSLRSSTRKTRAHSPTHPSSPRPEPQQQPHSQPQLHSAAKQPQLPLSPTPQPSPSTSDIENAPPSSLPPSSRPPPATSPSAVSPSPQTPGWTPIDLDLIFNATPSAVVSVFQPNGNMAESEKTMTVQEWIEHIAGKAEDELRNEGERIVGVFEGEGRRAMGVLEGIECI